MFKNLNIRPYIKYSAIAAIAYCIPVLFFIKEASYHGAWLLYLGNGLFMFAITYFMFSFNGKRQEDASSTSMLIAGHATAIIGIVMSCIICFLLMVLFVPAFFHFGDAGRVLTDSPASNVHGNTNGLSFMVFINAVFGNISVSSFVSIIFAFTIKRNQTRESTSLKQRSL